MRSPYLKALVPVVLGIGAIAVQYWETGVFNAAEWQTLGATIATALGVFAVRNTPKLTAGTGARSTSVTTDGPARTVTTPAAATTVVWQNGDTTVTWETGKTKVSARRKTTP